MVQAKADHDDVKDLCFERECFRLCPSPLGQSGDVGRPQSPDRALAPVCDLGGVEQCPRRMLREAAPVSMIRIGRLFPPGLSKAVNARSSELVRAME